MAEDTKPDDPLAVIDDAASKPPVTKEPVVIRSLEDLKGKQLDDSSYAALEEWMSNNTDSVADKRVSAAQKKWEKNHDKDMKDGKFMTADEVEAKIAQREAKAERKAEARANLITSLSEEGVKIGSDDYTKFKEALNAGIKAQDWDGAILMSRGGIRSVMASAGLLKASKAADTKSEDPRDVIPDQGISVKPVTKDKDDKIVLDADGTRRAKMQAALDAMGRE